MIASHHRWAIKSINVQQNYHPISGIFSNPTLPTLMLKSFLSWADKNIQGWPSHELVSIHDLVCTYNRYNFIYYQKRYTWACCDCSHHGWLTKSVNVQTKHYPNLVIFSCPTLPSLMFKAFFTQADNDIQGWPSHELVNIHDMVCTYNVKKFTSSTSF